VTAASYSGLNRGTAAWCAGAIRQWTSVVHNSMRTIASGKIPAIRSMEMSKELSAPESPQDPESGRVASLRGRADREMERGRHWFVGVRARTPFVELLAGVVERFVGERGTILAGYLAYRLFLLLLPLVVIIVALAGFSSTAASDSSEHLRLGRTLADTISTAGAEAHTGRFVLLITGLLAFIISAWGTLSALQYVSAQAWRIPTRRFPGKAKSFFGLAGSMLFFGLILYVAALVRNAGTVAGFAGTVATFASTSIAYFGLGWILPRRSKEWFWLLPGMAVGAIGHVALEALATFFLADRLASASKTYGALGITVTLFTYLYLLGLFVVIAVTANAVVWERHREDPPGILRRIADRVPIPTTRFGSGYIAAGETIETIAPWGVSGSGD
jgi:uncharacterized BrkB/YihY/UPF0761 family membrane protein